MTVEVLGAVLGTAIQGQIVGMASAPCIPGPGDPVPNMTNVSTADGHNGSLFVLPLDHTVNRRSSVRVFDRQRKYGVYCLTMNRGLACLTCVFIICLFFSFQKTAYMIASGVICLIYILCAVVLFFGVRERKGKSGGSACRRDFHAVFSSASVFNFASLAFSFQISATSAPSPYLSSRVLSL